MAYSTTNDISELLESTTLKGDVEEIDGAELGRGAYGRVFTVLYRRTVYAAKEIHPILYEEVGLEEKEAVRRSFLRECYYCSTLSHPNIVHFIGVYYPPHQPLHLPIMVMELMDSSLTSLIRNKSNLDIKVKNSILLDVTCGLGYLHDQKPPVIHRDLSPNNIMLSSELVAKIGDLGVAKAIRADSRRTKSKLTNAPGTTDFMPPEALHDDAAYDTSLDVFSFGGIILYVITEEWPTPKASTEFNAITRLTIGFNEVERRQHYLDKIIGNDVLKSLIERCLDNDPKVRPTAAAVLKALKFIDISATNASAASNKAVVQFLSYNSKSLPVRHIYQNAQQSGKRSYSVTNDTRPAIPPRPFIDITTNASAIHKVNKKREDLQFVSPLHDSKTLPVSYGYQNEQQTGKRSLSVSTHIPLTVPPRFIDISATNASAANDKAVVQLLSYNSKSLPVHHAYQNAQQSGKRSYSVTNDTRPAILPRPNEQQTGKRSTSLSVSTHIPLTIPPRILHPIPLSTLQSGKCHIKWTRCADLPFKMNSISLVADVEQKKVYASPNNSVKLNRGPYCIFCYDLVSCQWIHLPKLGHYRCVLLICNGQLHAIGGYDSKSHELTKKVSTYCETTKSWVSVYPDLLKARFKPGATAYQNHMIVAGGYTDKVHIADDIEILDCLQQPLLWKSCAVRLPVQMWALNFAICEEYLYIVGYYDTKHTKANAFRIPADVLISSIPSNKFHINSSYWLTLPPAPYFRTGLTSTSILLIVAGGSKASLLTSDIFRFDRFNNKWKKIGSLASPKAGVAVCTINDTIMVFGGYVRGGSIEASEESSLCTVEMGQVAIN